VFKTFSKKLYPIDHDLKEKRHLIYPVDADESMGETDMLYSGRLAFIYGSRSKVQPDDMIQSGLPIHGRQARLLSQMGTTGGGDFNTSQRLCSFEYLQRYFHEHLRTRVIDFKALVNDVSADMLDKLARNVPGDPKKEADQEIIATGGITTDDDGPFLCGNVRDRRLVAVTTKQGRSTKMMMSTGVKDTMLFQYLEHMLMNAGVFDWTPDGIVDSKLSQGDRLLDDELDSRDGELYNVTVGGPAVSSSWAGDYNREVMPLDKVFVVLVADVWHGLAKADTDTNYKTAWKTAKEYKEAKEAAMKDPKDPTEDKHILTNMRVRLVTSCEMINHSYKKANKDNTDTVDPTSRMGLMKSNKVSEYIIGGWCVGTVMDTAASRAISTGMNLMGAVKRPRTSFACNVNVNVKWWSADKLYRSYMNVQGLVRARYDLPKGIPDYKKKGGAKGDGGGEGGGNGGGGLGGGGLGGGANGGGEGGARS
jgi:uncharacterized membrane protein YgcG